MTDLQEINIFRVEMKTVSISFFLSYCKWFISARSCKRKMLIICHQNAANTYFSTFSLQFLIDNFFHCISCFSLTNTSHYANKKGLRMAWYPSDGGCVFPDIKLWKAENHPSDEWKTTVEHQKPWSPTNPWETNTSCHFPLRMTCIVLATSVRLQ